MSDKGLGKVIKKAIPKSVLTKLGIKPKKVTPVELKKLKEKAVLKSKNEKPIDNSTIGKLRNKLKNAMPEAQVKALRKKLNELEKGKKKQEVTKTLEKEKKKQVNLNTNQKTGLKTNKIVKGDETKDALKTSPLTQKELKDRGMVSGASNLRLSLASIKGKAKILANQVKSKKEQLAKLSSSDRAGEKGMLLRNAIKDMQKKLKGQIPINTLQNAGLMNKGGLAKPTTYKGGVLNGHGKNYGKPGGYNMGGLTAPTANQTGLKKLPTAVRNKMGYMYGGGMAKKKKVTNMDYRKGGLVIMIGQAKPIKKGKK